MSSTPLPKQPQHDDNDDIVYPQTISFILDPERTIARRCIP